MTHPWTCDQTRGLISCSTALVKCVVAGVLLRDVLLWQYGWQDNLVCHLDQHV